MKPANTTQTFSKLEAGTARAIWRRALPAQIECRHSQLRLIQKQKMKPANTKQAFSKMEAGPAGTVSANFAYHRAIRKHRRTHAKEE